MLLLKNIEGREEAAHWRRLLVVAAALDRTQT
jgi:hypothetical protein